MGEEPPAADRPPGAVLLEYDEGSERVLVGPEQLVATDQTVARAISEDLRVVVDRVREQGCLVEAALAGHCGDRAVVYATGTVEGGFLDGSWLADGTRFEDVFVSHPKRLTTGGLEPRDTDSTDGNHTDAMMDAE